VLADDLLLHVNDNNIELLVFCGLLHKLGQIMPKSRRSEDWATINLRPWPVRAGALKKTNIFGHLDRPILLHSSLACWCIHLHARILLSSAYITRTKVSAFKRFYTKTRYICSIISTTINYKFILKKKI